MAEQGVLGQLGTTRTKSFHITSVAVRGEAAARQGFEEGAQRGFERSGGLQVFLPRQGDVEQSVSRVQRRQADHEPAPHQIDRDG